MSIGAGTWSPAPTTAAMSAGSAFLPVLPPHALRFELTHEELHDVEAARVSRAGQGVNQGRLAVAPGRG